MPSIPGTVNFPASLDDAVSLIEATNNASSTLTGSISAADLLIPVSQPSEYPTTGVVTLTDSLTAPTKVELAIYTGKSGANLVVPSTDQRGAFGTTAQSWMSGDFVEIRPLAQHHETLSAAVRALQAVTGVGPDTPTAGKVRIGGTTPGSADWRVLLTADIPDLSGQYSPVAHAHSFASLTGKPTTLAGYGITDAYPLSSNPAGYLTNNQAITLGGDAGGTGTTSINVVIGARAITAAKFAAINANRLLGRFSAGAGDFEEVSIGANLSLSGAGVLSASAGLVSDTKANVLGLPVNPIQAAYATDTKEILVSDGAAWNLLPFRVVAESANPDMGGSQLSSRVGYGTDYVADKLLSNCLIGYNGKAQAGGFRITSANLLQVYLSAAWQNIPLGVSLRENAAYGQTLEFIPVGTSHYLEIMTGASLGNLAINGLPQTQSFKTSMGGVPYPTRIGGRVI